MESSHGDKVNLKQYRRIGGKWQFVPVVRQNGKPNPKLVVINGEPVSSKGGTFYLDWREDGKRRTQSVGTTPREALDAWVMRSGIEAGEIDAPDEAASLPTWADSVCLFVERHAAIGRRYAVLEFR